MQKSLVCYKKPNNSDAKFILSAILLLFGVLIAYIPATYSDFIWDDDIIITGNGLMRNLQGLYNIWFTPGALLQYYPLVHTSSWIEYQLFGADPLSYHLFNILLHALNAIFIFKILHQLKVPGAWLAAGLFALHPVHVESVAWASERKNVLSGLFYLLSILMAIQYWELDKGKNETKDVTSNKKFYFLSLFLYVCALHSKTVTVTLPIILLLLIWWKEGFLDWRKHVVTMVPFLIVGLQMGLLTVFLEKHTVGASGKLWLFTSADRLVIAGRSFWFYLSKLAYPSNLCFNYPKWEINGYDFSQQLFPLSAICFLLILWFLRKKINKAPFVAFAFFVITLFPALGFFNVFPIKFSFVADHFQYLASIGPITLFASVLSYSVNKLNMKKSLHALYQLFLIIVLSGFGTLSWQRCCVFYNLETLWIDTIGKNPSSSLAYSNLGYLYGKMGRAAEAVNIFSESIRRNPNDSISLRNLGRLANKIYKNSALADAYYEKAILVNGKDGYLTEIATDYGLALFDQHKDEKAIKYLYMAFRSSDQSNMIALRSLRDVIKKQENYDKKIEEYPEPLLFDNRLYYES